MRAASRLVSISTPIVCPAGSGNDPTHADSPAGYASFQNTPRNLWISSVGTHTTNE